jgi:hypothetical protein
MNHLRSLSVLVGVAAIGLLLALPAPHRPATASPRAAGPATLASVWPAAHPFTIPSEYPDGSKYRPRLIVDATASIGERARADGVHTDLVVAPASGPPRVLQTQVAGDGGSYEGITVADGRIVWMHPLSDSTGHAHYTLWTAALSGGPATELTADTGEPVFYNSGYDIQMVAGRIYWAANRPGHDGQTELRSVAVTGGRVNAQLLDGSWELSAWPWLVTTPTSSGARAQLRNMNTDEVVTVPNRSDQMAMCSPNWCRLTPNNSADTTPTTLIHPEGSQPHIVADTKALPVNSDVALLDRFELLSTLITGNTLVTVFKLALYDLGTGQSVLITPAATDATGSGAYVWWSTGDNETLTWQGLDLRTLR